MADLTSSPDAEVQELIIRSRRLVTRSERVKRWGIIYCAALLTIAVGILLWQARESKSTNDHVATVSDHVSTVSNHVNTVVSAIRQTQLTNTGISKNTNLTVKKVRQIFSSFEDCVQPSGACAKRSEDRTIALIVQLERTQLAQAVCSTLPSLPTDIQARQHAVSACSGALLNQKGP